MQSALKERIPENPPVTNEKSHRITIVLSASAAKNLDKLKTDNESGSFGELVRRSVQMLHRVYFHIGMPSLSKTAESEPLTHRVQALISLSTVVRIEELWAAEKEFLSSENEEEAEGISKSEIIRTALELYARVSDAQRELKEFIIEGRTGKINSSLSLAP